MHMQYRWLRPFVINWLLFASMLFLVFPAQAATTVAPGALLCWGDKAITYPPPPNRFIQISNLGDFYSHSIDYDGKFCAISEDNLLACWGQSTNYNNPPAASFKYVSLNYYHACGLKTNDDVVCWGNNVYGQTNAPAGTFKSVSAGTVHSCAVKSDGTLVCWGISSATTGYVGQTAPPTGTFLEVVSGFNHSCALATDNSIACWGDNSSGQASMPSGSFKMISAGGNNTCAIKTDGRGLCWGENDKGQTAAPTEYQFNHISAGVGISCGVKTDGTLSCWGDNTYNVTSNIPTQKAQRVSAGGTMSCAIRAADYISLSVTKTGTGTGTVTSAPAGINCGATCSANFTANSNVVLTAAAATGSTFGGWSNACAGTALTCTVAMNAAKTATANFKPATVNVPTATTNAATTVTATSAVLNGSVISSSATATVSFDFGTAPSYGTNIAATPAQVYSSTAVAVTATKTGLNCGTTYYYRVKAVTSAGTGLGLGKTFTTAACATGRRADFIITGLTLTPAAPIANGTFSLVVTVKNQGKRLSDGGFLDVWTNQASVPTCGAEGTKYLDVGFLNAGASKTFTITGLPAGAAGAKTARAFVDSWCEIVESNETNNQMIKAYSVQ